VIKASKGRELGEIARAERAILEPLFLVDIDWVIERMR
jgi:hypothetical protein